MRHAGTAALLLLFLNCSTTPPPRPLGPSSAARFQPPGYLRGSRTTSAQRVIIFVHGIFGNGTQTWTNETTGAYFPALVRDDPAFTGTDIWVYEYPSPKCAASYNIDQIPDDLHRRLTNDNVITNHREIIFLAHSMGGIIVRDYLLRNPARLTPERIPLLYFYSTPTLGAQVANITRHFCPSQQLNALRTLETRASSELAIFENHWQNSQFRTIPTFCAYETQRTHGIQIVERSSATHLCSSIEALNRDHVTITKPANTNDDSYIAFRNVYRAAASDTRAPRPTWNLNGSDQALLLITNTTSSPPGCKTCWSSHATVKPGDIIALSIFAHNASTIPAYGARTRLTTPTGPFASAQITAELRAPDTMPVAGSVYIESEGGAVALAPMTGTWYPEASKDDTRNNNLPYNQTVNDALTPEGFLLGDISPGWGHQTTLVLRFQCIPVTLLAIRNVGSLLPSATTPANAQTAQAETDSCCAPGHLQHSILDAQAQWIPDLMSILNDEILMVFITDYNETDAPLYNVTVTLTRTPTSDGEELNARIAVNGAVRRTGTATLEYLDKAITREVVPAGTFRFGSTASGGATCFKSLQELFTNTTVIDAPLEDGLVIGDVPPKTGFLIQLLIVGDEPHDEQVDKKFAAIEQSLKNAGITVFDDVFLTVARKGTAARNTNHVDHVMPGEQILVTLHFKNVGDVPARQTLARLVTARDVHTITLTGILHGSNTAAQGTAAKIELEPGQSHAHLQYVQGHRSYGKAYVPFDALHVATENGVNLDDIAPNEEGWLQITYVLVPDAKRTP